MIKDNYFYLRNSSCPCPKVKLSLFRNFPELSEWIQRECSPIENRDGEFLVRYTDLVQLFEEIERIVADLMKYSIYEIDRYDADGYPLKFWLKYSTNEFSPTRSKNHMGGKNLLKLYRSILSMMEILEEDEENDLYITFYGS